MLRLGLGRGRRRGAALLPWLLLVAVVGMSGCAAWRPAGDPNATRPVHECGAVPNVSDSKRLARAYHDSGAYDAELWNIIRDAEEYLARRALEAPRPAIILDIDETALSNWGLIDRSDFAYDAKSWAEWVQAGTATAIEPTLQLYRDARDRSVAVFFLSGRREALRAATERNLRAAGYPTWSGLLMKPDAARRGDAADFKAPERCKLIEQGWTIILSVGDQPSDLAGGCAERAVVLPNPFYRVP